jgi:hypothetical protein
MSHEEPRGADLARIALLAAKKAAAERGEHGRAQRKSPRRQSTQRRDGRDPMGLAGVFERLMAERGWEAPAAGGTVLDQWAAIATPEIADRLRAVAFDDATRRLDVLPESPAWRLQGQLIAAQLIRQANAVAGEGAVREIRILPAGSRPRQRTEPEPAPPPVAPAPASPVRTRETASAGYQRARAALATTPAEPSNTPVRTREDGCAGYHEVLAQVKTAKDKPPTAEEPVRTREDGCAGYHEVLALVRKADPDRAPSQATATSRDSASPGYQATRRALQEGKSRSRYRPTSEAPPPGT